MTEALVQLGRRKALLEGAPREVLDVAVLQLVAWTPSRQIEVAANCSVDTL